MGRRACCDKTKVKRGAWSPEEDALLKLYLHTHGSVDNWISFPLKAGLRRCGKSCRLRWLNYLRPNIKRGGFTQDEDSIICTLYNQLGTRWSIIASKLPGRTDNDVKNYWNTKLKKKLMGQGLIHVDAPKHNNNNNNNNNNHSNIDRSDSVSYVPNLEISNHFGHPSSSSMPPQIDLYQDTKISTGFYNTTIDDVAQEGSSNFSDSSSVFLESKQSFKCVSLQDYDHTTMDLRAGSGSGFGFSGHGEYPLTHEVADSINRVWSHGFANVDVTKPCQGFI